jgi:hypothetical protein
MVKIGNNDSIVVASPLSSPLDDVPHGGSFVFNDFRSLYQHIELLKQRGLVFESDNEEQRFAELIAGVSYYRISQYFKHFYRCNKTKVFKANTPLNWLKMLTCTMNT